MIKSKNMAEMQENEDPRSLSLRKTNFKIPESTC
jgi:hypothetical protein